MSEHRDSWRLAYASTLAERALERGDTRSAERWARKRRQAARRLSTP